MKTNGIIIGVAAVAILCGGIYLGSTLNSGDGADGGSSNEANDAAAQRAASRPSGLGSGGATSTKSSNSRESAWAKLTEKYGDSRTKLSKKITEDISKMMDDAMDLTDMGARLAGSESAAEMATGQTTNALARRLGLTDEQKEKASEIVGKRVSERFDAVRELSSAMNEDPSAMMETILAGDAYSRGEITEDQYNEITGETTSLLKNVAGFGGRGAEFSDPLLASELQPILTAEQQQKLSELTEQSQARANGRGSGGMPFQDGTLPAMDLEKLDTSVQSAQKLTGGLRAMMEGFSELQNVTPPAE